MAKVQGVYATVFKFMDAAITASNKEKAQALIWGDIDDEDIAILAEVTIDGAKKSKIVATGVRQVARAHNLLRVGLITGPRFMQTFKHYADHGGFILPWSVKEEAVSVANQN